MNSLDWEVCFWNTGNDNPDKRISDMTFNERWNTFQKEYMKLNMVLPFMLVFSPFLSLLVAMVLLRKMDQFWVIWIILLFISFLFWPSLNEDTFGHDCDRKGSQAIWPIFMPILCIIITFTIGVMSLLEKKKLKKL